MKKSGIFIKIAIELSRWIVAITFIFSGFVKLIDPRGFEYKLQDYLISLGMPELFPIALPFAIILSTLELTLGVFLLLGIYRKYTTRLLLAFMLVMTPLTLWVALKNPVKDCGCFGDAIVIDNWTTFYKNIILSICVIFLSLYSNRLSRYFKSKKNTFFAASYTVTFGILLGIYNTFNDPVIDFRPYKTGSNIAEKMYIDPQKTDVYENTFVYEKNGEQREFTEQNYPWNDSTWTFVEMRSRLIKSGEQPEIEDFSILRLQYDNDMRTYIELNDITDSILQDDRYLFLAISYNLNELNEESLNRLKAVNKYADIYGYPFYLLTASTPDEIGNWEKRVQSGFTFCNADERMLKTIIRTNPGLILLKHGTIINKWDSNSIPSEKQLDMPLSQSKLGEIGNVKNKNIRIITLLAILLFVPFGILKKIE